MNKQIDLDALRNSLSDWMTKLGAELSPGRFRFCLRGGLVPVEAQQGQVSTCFAMKIAWQIGIWDEWPEQDRQACVKFIQSFQREDGIFFDSWLSKNAKLSPKDYLLVLLGRISLRNLLARNEQNLRAETRQSAATLLMVGEKPLYPMPCEVNDTEDVKQYIHGLDWRNPWGAASHVGHQLFMLIVNRKCFGVPKDADQLTDAFLAQLVKCYDPATGTWHQGSPPDNIKINGAMKVFSGLQWLDRPCPDTGALLDFALAQPFQQDGCGFLNRLFVVQQAVRGVPEGYRREEVRDLALQVLRFVDRFRKKDGAFSFYPNKSQTRYYYARVSKGKPVSDLHGTVMMVWAIALALQLLGDDAPLGSELWRAHRA